MAAEVDFERALRDLQAQRAAELQATIHRIDALVDDVAAPITLRDRAETRHHGRERGGIPLPGPNTAVLPLEDIAAEWLDVGLEMPDLEVCGRAAVLHPPEEAVYGHDGDVEDEEVIAWSSDVDDEAALSAPADTVTTSSSCALGAPATKPMGAQEQHTVRANSDSDGLNVHGTQLQPVARGSPHKR